MNDDPRPRDPSEPPLTRSAMAALIERYDSPGPRYTSYPTAVEFHEGVNDELYANHLARCDRSADEALSVYMHLPFCDSRCLFCGCHVIISPHKERAHPYLDALKKEIDLLAKHLVHRRSVSQLHLGGGTPTYHSPAEVRDLLSHFFSHFELAPGAEAAAEVDPRVTSVEHLDVLADFGFNRISMGVQDFTPEVQQAIDRIQPREMTESLVQAARDRGFAGINLDLIYGLPFQRPETFEKTIDAVTSMKVDRSAVYSFAFVPWIRGHQKKLDEENLPSREKKIELFALARERFLQSGYEAIGMDHFALPDDELSLARRAGTLRRNFQGYTVIPASDVVGLGISAIGDLSGGYFQNEKKLSRYTDAIRTGRLPVERGIERSKDDEIRRAVIHDLMCNETVIYSSIESRFDIDFASYFDEDLCELRLYEKEGLVAIGKKSIEASPTGGLFIRNLARCFDRYWREKHAGGDQPIFSRTV